MADEVLALPRVVTQVTLARSVSPPSHPCHCRGNGQPRKALLAWDSTAAMPATSPWIIYCSPPCSVASQVDGACGGWLQPAPVVFWEVVQSRSSIQLERLARGRGRASELFEASPQPVDSVTLARFYPRFLQRPPRPSHFFLHPDLLIISPVFHK